MTSVGDISVPSFSPRRALHQKPPAPSTELPPDLVVWSWAEESLSPPSPTIGTDSAHLKISNSTAKLVASTLAPGTLSLICEEAGRLSVTPEESSRGDQALLSYAAIKADPNQQARFDTALLKLQPYLKSTLKTAATASPDFSHAAASHQAFVAKPSDFESDELLLFAIAHEAHHCQSEDLGRVSGVNVLETLEPRSSGPFHNLAKTLRQTRELAADRFAAQVAAAEGCSPLSILKNLMTTEESPSHPDGLSRANQVRQFFAESGKNVTAEEWDLLLQETSADRAKKQAGQERAKMMNNSINWDLFQ